MLARPHDYLPLHLVFVSLIVLAASSAVVCLLIVQHPGYTPVYAIISLKTSAIDHYLMLFVFLAAIQNSNEGLWIAKGMIAVVTLGCIVSLADMFGAGLGIMTPRGDGRLRGHWAVQYWGSDGFLFR
jgi:hypothetical protein